MESASSSSSSSASPAIPPTINHQLQPHINADVYPLVPIAEDQPMPMSMSSLHCSQSASIPIPIPSTSQPREREMETETESKLSNSAPDKAMVEAESASFPGSPRFVGSSRNNKISPSRVQNGSHHVSENSLTWPQALPSSPSFGNADSNISNLPHSHHAILNNPSDPHVLPLPIHHVPQSSVHLMWRLASQNISIRLEEDARRMRRLQSSIAARSGRTHGVADTAPARVTSASSTHNRNHISTSTGLMQSRTHTHTNTMNNRCESTTLEHLFDPISETRHDFPIAQHTTEEEMELIVHDTRSLQADANEAQPTQLKANESSATMIYGRQPPPPLKGSMDIHSSLRPSASTSPSPTSPILRPRESLDGDWHQLSLDDICAQFECNAKAGLREAELPARRLKYGANVLSSSGNPYWKVIKMFLRQLVGGFGLILWAAALLAFLAWRPLGDPPETVNLALGIVLVMVILCQALFNFYQEYSSNAIMDSFKDMIPGTAIVIRQRSSGGGVGGGGGSGSGSGVGVDSLPLRANEVEVSLEQEVNSSELIVGDLVKIPMGAKIPADIRLIEVHDLKVNNSALTGEMEPIACTVNTTSHNFLESTNVVFFGSLAVEGSGMGIVVATGDQTVLGKISKLSNDETAQELSLHIELGRFIKFIVVAGVSTAIITAIGWAVWVRDAYPSFMPVADLIVNVTGLVVAYVPSGLPIAVTLTLTLVALRMFRQHVLVKNLAAVETFNSVTVIATDKTGTLTTNVMSVANIYYGLSGALSNSIATRGVGIHAHDTKHSLNYAAYRQLIQGAQLCNNAVLRSSGIDLENAADQESNPRNGKPSSFSSVGNTSPLTASGPGGADLTAAVQSLSMELSNFIRDSKSDADGAHQRLLQLVTSSPTLSSLFASNSLLTNMTPTYSIHGDAADSAFYTFCLIHLGLNVEMTRAMYAREFVLPFNSKNKFMITVHREWSHHKDTKDVVRNNSTNLLSTPVKIHTLPANPSVHTNSAQLQPPSPVSFLSSSSPPAPSSIYPPLDVASNHPHLVWMKGACEIVLARCTTYMTDEGEEAPLTPTILKQLLQRLESLGKQGERVLGFARRQMDFHDWRQKDEAQRQQAVADGEQQSSDSREEKATANDPPGVPSREFCFVGMISLIDPPRSNVSHAVLRCRRAGIHVAMITGDHPLTSCAIARKVNILSATSTYELRHTDPVEDGHAHQPGQHGRANSGQNSNQAPPIPLHSIDFQTSDDGVSSVVLLRDGVEYGRYQPMNSNDGDDAQQSPTVDRAKQWAAKKAAMVRGRLKNVLLNPMPPKDRQVNGLVPSDTTSISIEPEFELIPTPTSVLCPGAPLAYALVLTGSQLRLLDDYLWDWVMRHTEGVVFARTSPEQKLRIVMEYQKRGHVVAMTGDGVNDAPSLKRADLGIAMQAGAEVAREAADIILLDNNFSSIVHGIEMGRTVFDNLKKVLLYLLPAGSFSEMLPVIANVFLGMPLPLSPFLMVVICVLTDMGPALALVNEKPESQIMTRSPRDVDHDRLVDGKLLFFAYLNIGMIESFCAFLLYFLFMNDQGIPPSGVLFAFDSWTDGYYGYSQDELDEIMYEAQSLFFLSLVITQFGNLLAVRTRRISFFQQNPFYGPKRNLHIPIAMCVSALIAVLFTQIEWINSQFHTRPVDAVYVLPALGFAAFIFLYDETRKYIVRKYPKSITAKLAW